MFPLIMFPGENARLGYHESHAPESTSLSIDWVANVLLNNRANSTHRGTADPVIVELENYISCIDVERLHLTWCCYRYRLMIGVTSAGEGRLTYWRQHDHDRRRHGRLANAHDEVEDET